MRMTIILAGLMATAFHSPLIAASLDQQSGWAAWSNSIKLSDRWSLISDVQLRSNDGWERPRNFIGRAGASYALTPTLSLAAGYAYIDTYTPDSPTLTENRTWQQLLLVQKIGGNPLTHRLRLEQRFIERATGGDVYSDRLRYFARLQVPLQASGSKPFSHGYYAAFQNEVLLHLSGRSDLNGQLFDQNRAYAGIGFRISPRADVEVGYLNQHLNGRTRDTDNHVVQFSLFTRFL